ncbi:MAG: hypothetical protein LUJ25_00550 [Firmicutes bacterium]|nr:hypothetical protein [Bacillota bacterium]
MFDNNINAAKDSVDAFFRSLTTGDWSVFSNGIIAAFTDLRELSALMDELADKKLSLSYIKAEDLKEIEQYETVAKDTNRSLVERQQAAEKMAMAVKHLSNETANYIKSSEEGLAKTYKANYGVNVDRETLDYFFKYTNKSDDSVLSEIDKYKKERLAIEKQYTTTTTVPSTFGATTISTLSKAGKEALKEYDKQNEFIRTQSVLLEEVDDKRVATLNVLKEQYSMEREIYSLQKRTDETGRSVNKSGSTTIKKQEIIPEGSLAELDKKLAEWRKKFNDATTLEARLAADKMVKEISQQKAHLNVEVKYGKASDLKELVNKQKIPTLSVKGKNVQEQMDNDSFDIKPIKSSVIDANYSYAESPSAIAGVMGSVTNMTNEGAAAWISWGANILTAIAAAIPAITTLTVAKKAEATANSEAAVTGGMASVASIPFVGWIMALSAGAAIIAAMASIPKFADDIFSGNSFIGDNMIARVNSGEMILNNRQQKNLFNLLDGKGGTASLTGGSVEFKIKGKELVGVLNAQASKTSKYK